MLVAAALSLAVLFMDMAFVGTITVSCRILPTLLLISNRMDITAVDDVVATK